MLNDEPGSTKHTAHSTKGREQKKSDKKFTLVYVSLFSLFLFPPSSGEERKKRETIEGIEKSRKDWTRRKIVVKEMTAVFPASNIVCVAGRTIREARL